MGWPSNPYVPEAMPCSGDADVLAVSDVVAEASCRMLMISPANEELVPVVVAACEGFNICCRKSCVEVGVARTGIAIGLLCKRDERSELAGVGVVRAGVVVTVGETLGVAEIVCEDVVCAGSCCTVCGALA